MTRETKVGLLVGMGIILLIGIVVSDHLSKVQQQTPANFTDMSRETFDSLMTNNRSSTLPDSVPVANTARAALQGSPTPLPLPGEVITPAQPSMTEQPSRPLYSNPTESRYTPQPIQPSRVTPPQPATPTRAITPQPRRVEDMSEEHAVASNNATPRLNPHMAIALDTRTTNPTPTPSRTGTYHKVTEGDNLFLIAQRYYGDGKLWRLIRDANPNLVSTEGTIMLNSRLLIPSKKQVDRIQSGEAAAHAAPREIVVESGQTLSELAKIHLGNAGDWDELLKANRDRLNRPEELRAGMTLRLPKKAIERAAARQPETTTRRTPPSNNTNTSKTYTIESGDTLSAIAAKTMGSSNKWYKLYQHNKSVIDDPDNLTVGKTIKIP
ncbi:MAG: LysM peptidoglycan-binding domain-containing protein [Phycisphaeraceae bacterium JB051]